MLMVVYIVSTVKKSRGMRDLRFPCPLLWRLPFHRMPFRAAFWKFTDVRPELGEFLPHSTASHVTRWYFSVRD